MATLPPHLLLSFRKRVTKLDCETLAVRYVAETGYEQVPVVDHSLCSTCGSYGLGILDVRGRGGLCAPRVR